MREKKRRGIVIEESKKQFLPNTSINFLSTIHKYPRPLVEPTTRGRSVDHREEEGNV